MKTCIWGFECVVMVPRVQGWGSHWCVWLQIHADLMEHVIKPVVPEKYLDDKTIFHLNPSGARFRLLPSSGSCYIVWPSCVLHGCVICM